MALRTITSLSQPTERRHTDASVTKRSETTTARRSHRENVTAATLKSCQRTVQRLKVSDVPNDVGFELPQSIHAEFVWMNGPTLEHFRQFLTRAGGLEDLVFSFWVARFCLRSQQSDQEEMKRRAEETWALFKPTGPWAITWGVTGACIPLYFRRLEETEKELDRDSGHVNDRDVSASQTENEEPHFDEQSFIESLAQSGKSQTGGRNGNVLHLNIGNDHDNSSEDEEAFSHPARDNVNEVSPDMFASAERYITEKIKQKHFPLFCRSPEFEALRDMLLAQLAVTVGIKASETWLQASLTTAARVASLAAEKAAKSIQQRMTKTFSTADKPQVPALSNTSGETRSSNELKAAGSSWKEPGAHASAWKCRASDELSSESPTEAAHTDVETKEPNLIQVKLYGRDSSLTTDTDSSQWSVGVTVEELDELFQLPAGGLNEAVLLTCGYSGPDPPRSKTPDKDSKRTSINLHLASAIEKRDLALDVVLHNPIGLDVLRAFMTSEYNEENLDFHLAVSHFESRKRSAFDRHTSARMIYDHFIATKAPCQINVSHQIVHDIRKKFKQSGLIDNDIFTAAQRTILKSVKSDVFPRFLRSKLHNQLLDFLEYHSVQWSGNTRHMVLRRTSAKLRPIVRSSTPPCVSAANPPMTRSLLLDTRRATTPPATMAHGAEMPVMGASVWFRHVEPVHAPVASNNKLTLQEAFADTELLNAFMQFCVTEYSEENLLCWFSVQDYKEMHKSKGSRSQRADLAHRIIQQHVATSAPFSIAISGEDRKRIMARVKTVPADLFADAEKVALNLLTMDSFPRFLKSPLYKTLLQAKLQQHRHVHDGTTGPNRRLGIKLSRTIFRK